MTDLQAQGRLQIKFLEKATNLRRKGYTIYFAFLGYPKHIILFMKNFIFWLGKQIGGSKTLMN